MDYTQLIRTAWFIFIFHCLKFYQFQASIISSFKLSYFYYTHFTGCVSSITSRTLAYNTKEVDCYESNMIFMLDSTTTALSAPSITWRRTIKTPLLFEARILKSLKRSGSWIYFCLYSFRTARQQITDIFASLNTLPGHLKQVYKRRSELKHGCTTLAAHSPLIENTALIIAAFTQSYMAATHLGCIVFLFRTPSAQLTGSRALIPDGITAKPRLRFISPKTHSQTTWLRKCFDSCLEASRLAETKQTGTSVFWLEISSPEQRMLAL